MLTSEQVNAVIDNINRKVHWYGFADIARKPKSLHNSLARLLYAIDYDFTYPLIVYLLIGRMLDLEELTHTSVDRLNEVGVTIYLNEPLSLREEDGYLRAEELDSILLYTQRNGLTNVTVYTCDYRCDKLLPYYSTLRLVTDDIFIKTIRGAIATLPTEQFTKKFINLNWRYTEHRHLVAAFMHPMDGYCSWKYSVDSDALSVYEWADIPKLDNEFNGRIYRGIDLLNENVPCNVDIPGPSIKVSDIEYTHDVDRPKTAVLENIEPFYADVFCDVVTETKYAQLLGNISEKTLRPIRYLKPFILVAPPRSLEYVRTLGYKTFSDYWDESYDLEEDHNLRLIKIFKLVDHINSKTIDELKTLYNDMLPVLTHNAELLAEKLPHKTAAQRLAGANSALRRAIWEVKTLPSKNT